MGKKILVILINFIVCGATIDATVVGSVADTLSQGKDSVEARALQRAERDTLMPTQLWLNSAPLRLTTADGVDVSLYNALQLMPGAQVQGETGALVVRGGSSGEQLTFIDGMHVMCPYTSPSGSSLARSSYSAHIVDGFSLLSGSAPAEYGGALSAVVAIDTKDVNRNDCLGAMLSTGGASVNGNKSFSHCSVSADVNYQNLGLGSRLMKCRTDYAKPFTMLSAASQFRLTPSSRTAAKVYVQCDKTSLALNSGDSPKFVMAIDERNLYLNSTLRHTTLRGWHLFAGAAWSSSSQLIDGLSANGGTYRTTRSEVHLKVKVRKALTPMTSLDAGAESYIRNYRTEYRASGVDYTQSVSPTSAALFANLRLMPMAHLAADIALCSELSWPCQRIRLMPRASLSYTYGELTLNCMAGRYTRQTENANLLTEPRLKPEACQQYSLGAKYHHTGRTAVIEAYVKRYSHLPLNIGTNQWGQTLLSSNGSGSSRGFDLFYSDKALLEGLEVQMTYSFNLSRRRWMELSETQTPQFATRHNATVALRYTYWPLRTIISLTDRFSSGRPGHDPLRTGNLNCVVRPYNSLDASITLVMTKNVVAYASLTNILCRKNVFGLDENGYTRPSQDNSLYVGLILTLNKK